MLRKDVLIAFAAIGGLELSSLIITIPFFLHMLILTGLIVYVGTYFSAVPASQKPEGSEVLEKQDALMFPLIGSVVLFSLYLVFKIFPLIVVQFLVKIYFGVLAAYVVSSRLQQVASGFLTPEVSKKLDTKVTIPMAPINAKLTPVIKQVKEQAKPLEPHVAKAKELYEQVKPKAIAAYEKVEDFVSKLPETIPALKDYVPKPKSKVSLPSVELPKVSLPSKKSSDDIFPSEYVLTQFDAACYSAGILFAFIYAVTDYWLLNNIIAICFAIQALELINIGSFFNAAILLSGLFVYDIFWVFGTDVMVTVAKKFNGPIKLVFPRSGDAPHAMLGLGDVVIPGFFIALMLRFDRKLNRPKTSTSFESLKTPGADFKANLDKFLDFFGNLTPSTFKTEFFNVVLLSYVLGLVFTIVIMAVFNAAQPALLYLVPAVLGSTVGLAYYRGKPTFDALLKYEAEEDATAAVASKIDDAKKSVKSTLGSVSNKASSLLDDAADSLKKAEEEANQVDVPTPSAPSAEQLSDDMIDDTIQPSQSTEDIAEPESASVEATD